MCGGRALSPWGKLAGCSTGLYFGGPFGALFGLALGHALDSGVAPVLQRMRHGPVNEVFFESLFRVLGALAKSDGRVSEQEIAIVDRLMDRLQLAPGARSAAIKLFNTGRRDPGRWRADITDFAGVSRKSAEYRRLYAESVIAVAVADGWVKGPAQAILDEMADLLDLDRAWMADIVGRVSGSAVVDDPYQLLGVEQGASNAEIKKAYRRQLSQHHPDKLSGRGVTGHGLQLAAERTREMREAYEKIRKERNF